METTHRPYRSRGVPRWLFWSAVPVVLAMGFVTGMAIATYTTDDAAEPRSEVVINVPAPSVATTTPPPSTSPQPQVDTSWRIISANGSVTTPVNNDLGEHPLEAANGLITPAVTPPKFTGPATTMDEARKALASDFGVYSHEGAVFRVEYQRMTPMNRGRSIVGIISLEDYRYWEKAVAEAPVALTAWLQKAAERVLDASKREGFHIAWAVVASPDQRPEGFADHEITAMDNGSFSVIRRLASTLDHTKTEISLRSLSSLQQAAANKAVTSNEPWATYGPVIRFDSSDVYRPSLLAGAKPKQ